MSDNCKGQESKREYGMIHQLEGRLGVPLRIGFMGRVTGKKLAKWAEGVNFVPKVRARRWGEGAASAPFDPCCRGAVEVALEERSQEADRCLGAAIQSNGDDGTFQVTWDSGKGKAKGAGTGSDRNPHRGASWG